jgi:hypothetical protein
MNVFAVLTADDGDGAGERDAASGVALRADPGSLVKQGLANTVGKVQAPGVALRSARLQL